MSTTSTTVSQAAVLSKPMKYALSSDIYTVDELIRRRASELEEATLLGAPKEGLIDFEEHSARAVDEYVDAAAQRLQELGLGAVTGDHEKPPVVGILAQSSLHVVISILGLSRLGYAAFLLSTRLAGPGLTQLLNLADCNTILTTPNLHSGLEEAQKEREIHLLPLLDRSDYYGKRAPRFTRSYNAEQETKKLAIVLHSSGSTGLPKPIYLTNSSCIASFATNLDRRAFITSPLFHSHGFYETFRSIYSGKPIYYCNYAVPLTRQNLIDMITYLKPDLFHCVPYVLKLLAETDEGIDILASINLVQFGGSSCPDELGDRLVERGVYLSGNYGATETGRLMTSTRPAGDKAWNYLRCLPQVTQYVLMDEIAPGLYECVALDGLKSKSTTNSDDPPGSFRTRDLFASHPTRPGLWKFVSRIDDRFTLINGEKVLPIPMEGRIRQDQLVQEACVFGEGKSFPGVLIVKTAKAAHLSDNEFLQKIWPAVEAANQQAETFSRIPMELSVVLPADASYPHTDKGTFIRVPMYRQYDKEIQAAYERFENAHGGTLCLEGENLEEYILLKIEKRFGIKLESVESDFFASGIDSLQCIQMWNLIKAELDLGGRQSQLSQNVLYETGTAKALASHLTALRTGSEQVTKDELQTMEDLILKYSTFTPHHLQTSMATNGEVILLTGATGGLGAHLLAQLTAQPTVTAVWAMVRASTDAMAAERVFASLKNRGISLRFEEKNKVLALSCDLSQPDLGLDPSRWADLQPTHVIHSAWAVNFNLSVRSFEDQHIKAVHNLIQLCLSVKAANPARFFFCSSVSAAGGTPRPGTVEEGPVSTPSYAQNTGYARSKYVAEHITRNAMRYVGLPARVLRIGQLVGDSKMGEWNTTEGVPLMIQTAATLGALPKLDEEMTWLPVDYAAKVILDLATIGAVASKDRDVDPHLAYHVLNPNRFHWSQDMLPALASAGLEFEAVSTEKWMETLRASDRDPSKNPPIKLLEWFESKYGHGAKSGGRLVYLTDETYKDSESLRQIPDVTSAQFVKMMLDRLRTHWNA